MNNAMETIGFVCSMIVGYGLCMIFVVIIFAAAFSWSISKLKETTGDCLYEIQRFLKKFR